MSIDLRTFASGDTDYIAKLNANMEALKSAIDALQYQMGAASGLGGAGGAVSVGQMIGALFNNADALIGPGSYKVLTHATTVTVDPGAMYLADNQTVVASNVQRTISFAGMPAATYYIIVDVTGLATRQTSDLPGAIYSVYWSGTSFGTNTKLVPTFYDTLESEASRKSIALNANYTTLDARLEAGEGYAKEAKQDADQALAKVYELESAFGGPPYRKVGVTVDGTTGLKGAIQVDFGGTIMGWSLIADRQGSITVEVSVKSPTGGPPAAPAIPNEVTDKITASAPISMTSAWSAARAEAGVTSWARTLQKWDTIQFNVVSVFTITRATLYLRIMQEVPSLPELAEFNELEFDGVEELK